MDVTMNEFRYDPPTWMVFAEQPVTIHLQNSGTMPHTWTVMKSPISSPDTPINPSDILFDSGQIDAGATKTVTFTAPSAPGDYQVISTEPGHMEAGMVGQLTVR